MREEGWRKLVSDLPCRVQARLAEQDAHARQMRQELMQGWGVVQPEVRARIRIMMLPLTSCVPPIRRPRLEKRALCMTFKSSRSSSSRSPVEVQGVQDGMGPTRVAVARSKETRPDSPISIMFDQDSLGFDKFWPELDQLWPDSGQNWPDLGQTRPMLARCPPDSTTSFGPT